RYSAAIILALSLAACGMPHPPLQQDASNPLKRIAVLPLKNDTTDVEGVDLVRKKMVQALEYRSYVVKDLKETDQILRDQMGITLGGQLSLTTPQKLGETLGVEGVLYGTLMDFDESTLAAINVKKVRGTFNLVNTMTGESVWQRGLGVRSEMMMGGRTGAAAAGLARAADARDKDAPWVTIETISTGNRNLGESFAIGLGAKLLTKAVGKHLDHESSELARRVTDNLPWGPGPDALASMPTRIPAVAVPEIRMPAPPSFGYMDWEGKRDFTATIYSTTSDKRGNGPVVMEMPLAVSGDRLRMDMDLSKTMKSDSPLPLARLVVIERGDKKTGYTLYPDARRYLVHTENEETGEKPRIEKTRVGSEMLGKHPTEKYLVKMVFQDGTVEEGYIWNAKDLAGLTIKSETENKDRKTTVELRNIVLKKPAASLFEIPAGYVEAKGVADLMAIGPQGN
ncbi:MAG TPA: GNA1162 family protein, partial [Nitrospirota bacterium]